MSTDPATAWPLSAAATQLLRRPRTQKPEVVRLALKELIVRRAWRLDVERRRGRLGRERVTRTLRPGPAPVPAQPVLRELDASLRQVAPGGGELRGIVQHVMEADRKLPTRLQEAAREELAARGLVALERSRILGVVPRTKAVPTAAAEGWRRAAEARMSGLRGADAATVAALGGLVLLLDPAPMAELDATLKRLRDQGSGGGDGGSGGSTDSADGLDLDLGDFSVLDDLDGGFDSDVDAGSSDGGGDGSGGGDGGGGGGD